MIYKRVTATNRDEPRRTAADMFKINQTFPKLLWGVLGGVLVGCWDNVGCLVALLWLAKI